MFLIDLEFCDSRRGFVPDYDTENLFENLGEFFLVGLALVLLLTLMQRGAWIRAAPFYFD